MFAFLRKRIGKQRKSSSEMRAAYAELRKQESEYQLRINELNYKIEKQQQRQQEILEKGKRETGELARLGLAEQYARGERQVRRLFDRRRLLVKAQELIEVQMANLELQDILPDEILNLTYAESQREQALTDMVRDRLDQAYDEMLASFDNATADSQRDTHEQAAIQAVLALFDREHDEEIKQALHAIEAELGTGAAGSLFQPSERRAREIE